MAVGFTLVQAGQTGIAPPVFAASLILAVLLGELSQPRPDRDSFATAAIEVRRVRDYLPSAAVRRTAAIATALIGGLTVIGALGILDGPDLPSSYVDLGWYGPFSEYGTWAGNGLGGLLVSTMVTAVATILLGLVTLRIVVRSPRAGADAYARRRDERWRRRVASTLAATVGWVLSVPLVVWSFLVSATVAESGSGGQLLSLIPSAVGASALLAAAGYVSILVQPSDRPDVLGLAGPAETPATVIDLEKTLP